ncbi:hypothetical protein [Hirschia baltica]|uniref:Cation/multidrug efflux pump n=1 Tax=Hirschia baltica (strain ATCC 49814 / DSM 5838 / IFAM 1418) TaxID=582402 RepID=C6XN39_HIRBI|nr:hypothetical protein [Hirschia baltica]ACT58209.1 conserved hypothetical protein [Hirschia baltica ATCC 49814]
MNISIWWAIPALTGLIGVLMVGGGLGRLFRFKMFSGLSRFLFGGVFLSGTAVAVLAGMNLQTYARLTYERPAAEITFSQTSPQAFTATMRVPTGQGEDFGEPVIFELTGDAFRVDARFLKWKPWANVTGYDAIFRLDRLQGRFDEVNQENNAPPKAFDLSPVGTSAALDIYQLSRKNEIFKNLKAVDAIYGNGAYAPMADGAVYEVVATQSGLVPRPKNEAAREAALQWGAPTSLKTPSLGQVGE